MYSLARTRRLSTKGRMAKATFCGLGLHKNAAFHFISSRTRDTIFNLDSYLLELTMLPACPGPRTRRAFLQAGALGLGGLTLPNLLKAEHEAGVRTSTKSVIL